MKSLKPSRRSVRAQDELRDKRDQATREVWTAYIAFRTALRKEQAAVALLESANASYSASLDAYKYGVKNLIDVVTAERQLAQARFSSVSARSQLFLEAVDLEFVTGNLLRTGPRATTTTRLRILWFLLLHHRQLHLLPLRHRTVANDEQNSSSLSASAESVSSSPVVSGAPALNVIGSFFPAWMVCLIISVVLTGRVTGTSSAPSA